MRFAVIGHGPSALGAKQGKLIDKSDFVVRMKDPTWQNRKDYGSKTDAILVSNETAWGFSTKPHMSKFFFWVYPKKLRVDPIPFRYWVDLELTREWIERFRRISLTTNFSLGTAAALYACHHGAKEILMVGCDNLLDPTIVGYEKADLSTQTGHPGSFSGPGPWKSHHEWKAENVILRDILEHYGVGLR